LKTYLKNKRAYARKRGYLKESTNQNQGQHHEEEDEDEDAGHEDEEEEENAGHDDDEEEEEEEDMWNRGDGWGMDFEGDDVPA
jgi:hypothetical protein